MEQDGIVTGNDGVRIVIYDSIGAQDRRIGRIRSQIQIVREASANRQLCEIADSAVGAAPQELARMTRIMTRDDGTLPK